MSIIAFLTSLLSKIGSSADWLKLYREPKTGNKGPSSVNRVKIGKDSHIEGDLNINQQNVILLFDPRAADFSELNKKDVLQGLSSAIASHEGAAIDLDGSVSVSTSVKLTVSQKKTLKLFKEASWGTEKLTALRTAYKMMNLEDAGMQRDAETLANSAFGGRNGTVCKKMYNLARAGYTQGFAMDIMSRSDLRSDKAISEILDFYGPAVFLDDHFGSLQFVVGNLNQFSHFISHGREEAFPDGS